MQKVLSEKNLIKSDKESLSKVPKTCGVYIFLDKEKKPLYVGKSVNLRSRLTSYFSGNLHFKTKQMVSKARFINFIEVSSEIEALLLEAKLVKRFNTFYNLRLKDDKSPLYIAITDDEYERVVTTRRPKKDSVKYKKAYGPFPSAKTVRMIMRLLRRVFPYSTHKLSKRRCFYSQIGLCDPCPSVIEKLSGSEKRRLKEKYKRNIKNIIKFLDGKVDKLIKQTRKEMLKASKAQKYEKANEYKRKLEMIKYITQPVFKPQDFIENPNLRSDIRRLELNKLKEELEPYIKLDKDIERIECFDISHHAGKLTAASMVTFVLGEPDKNLYRRFKIRQEKGDSDTDSLKEVAKRRKKYFKKWGRPDLIIVDGGKPQVSTFLDVLSIKKFPIVGIAKRNEKLVIPEVTDGKLKYHKVMIKNREAKHLIQRIRDEAHRFARKYHHKLLQKALIKE